MRSRPVRRTAPTASMWRSSPACPQAAIKRAEEVLKTLEQGEQASALTRLADDLPLFAVTAAPEPTKLSEPSAAETELRSINPDELSPKEALELLYKLRGLVGLK